MTADPFLRVDELEREVKTLKDKIARLEAFVEIDRLSAPVPVEAKGTLHLPPRGKH